MESKVKTIGSTVRIDFPELDVHNLLARVDTGARTSALWVTDIQIQDGKLSCVLFAPGYEYYTGNRLTFDSYDTQMVTSSNGVTEERFRVRLLVRIKGKKIRASFTLANRALQIYPVLIGRNVLLGKFIVDVKKVAPESDTEQQRRQYLEASRNEQAGV